MATGRRQFVKAVVAAAAAPALTTCDAPRAVPAARIPPNGFDAGSTAEGVTEGSGLPDANGGEAR